MHYRNLGGRSTQTPQTEPIPGKEMVQNNAGAYSFSADDWLRFRRFLILGTAGGTYYVGERKLTKDNLEVVERLLRAGQGRQVVDLIVEISQAGRAASNEPALFALARCAACDVRGQVEISIPEKRSRYLIPENRPMRTVREAGGKRELADGETTTRKNGSQITRTGRWIEEYRPARSGVKVPHPEDIEVRQYALANLHKVARTGTYILHFVGLMKQFRGWGKTYKAAVAGWYNKKPESRLAYQLLKYQSRDGYGQRDLLRLAHPRPDTSSQKALYHWSVKGWPGIGEEPHPDEALRQIWAFEKAKRATSVKEVANLIRVYQLPREAVPTQYLNEVEIWDALLDDMPMEAMLRNLATMTRVGLLKPLSDALRLVLIRLGSATQIQASRLHPIKILAALTTYASGGQGVRSEKTWEPLDEIIDSLNQTFYSSFGNVEPTGKRVLLSIDVSGSMHGTLINGIAGVQCHKAAAAMALVTAACEQQCHISGYDTRYYPLRISGQRLDTVAALLHQTGGGGTDCGVPIEWALHNNIQVDAFVSFTDSESWAGNRHVSQSLEQYRQRTGLPARAINVQMAATGTRLSDPADQLSLEMIGFDTSTPALISEFVGGAF